MCIKIDVYDLPEFFVIINEPDNLGPEAPEIISFL